MLNVSCMAKIGNNCELFAMSTSQKCEINEKLWGGMAKNRLIASLN